MKVEDERAYRCKNGKAGDASRSADADGLGGWTKTLLSRLRSRRAPATLPLALHIDTLSKTSFLPLFGPFVTRVNT